MVPFLSLQVADVMSTEVITVPSTMALSELRQMFESHKFNGFPVVDDEQFIGWVTEFDLLRAFVFTANTIIPAYEEILSRRVDSIITPEPEIVAPERPLSRLLEQMVQSRHPSYPVLNSQGTLAGVVARRDILNGLRADPVKR